MDSSGANDLEIQAINKEIAHLTQDYTDAKIDQALSNLSDANEKASEQRER
jgi:hypothetical protein